MKVRTVIAILPLGLIFVLQWNSVPHAVVQHMPPRAFWPAPDGTRIAVVGFSFVSGDVLVDPSLPIDRRDDAIDRIPRIYVSDLEKMKTWTPPEAVRVAP